LVVEVEGFSIVNVYESDAAEVVHFKLDFPTTEQIGAFEAEVYELDDVLR